MAKTEAWVLLERLPELVAEQERRGCPVVVEDPGTAHGRALVLALGATIKPAPAKSDLRV